MAVSFAKDIRPLFTDTDIAHMNRRGVRLDDFGYMHDLAHAQQVLDRVDDGGMPPPSSGEPAWSPEKVRIFRDWIAAGCQP
jgi:hypothetical protein